MESLSHSTMVQVERICQLLSNYLQTGSNVRKSSIQLMKQKRFVDQKDIQSQMDGLKWNIKKMTQTCQSLQNQNRVLKRMIIRSGSTSSVYSIESGLNTFQNETCLLNKYLSKVTSSHYSTDLQMSNIYDAQSPTNFYNSSSQFERIKKEVVGLTENLKSMKKAYQKYQLDSTNDNQVKDMFLNQSSLIRFGSRSGSDNDPSSSREQINLQNLLCDEELSFDDLPMQEKSFHRVSNQQNMVESLIAKGIEFRESRAMRSKEYQTLSDRIQQYREEFKNKENLSQSNFQSMSKYR